MFAIALAGCEEARHAKALEQEVTREPLPLVEAASEARAEPTKAVELYSTLAGKMARMEELLNGIDRLLDQPSFRERLVANARELHQLLIESRGLYPTELPAQDRTRFDQAIDQAAAESVRLLESIQADDLEAAREAIECLCRQRQEAHARYSN